MKSASLQPETSRAGLTKLAAWMNCSSVACPLFAGHREGTGLNVGVAVFCSRTGHTMTVSWKPARATVDTASPSSEARSAVQTLLGWPVKGPLQAGGGERGNVAVAGRLSRARPSVARAGNRHRRARRLALMPAARAPAANPVARRV